jgi:Berberine and berberine like
VTQAFSLACTGPIVSMTGIAGFTLGGGLGSLSCDNLLAAEVVTAGGEIIHASETENNDLLWGLKGAGWNFGVVTTMELRLHRGPTVVAGLIYWPLIQFSNLVDHHRSLMDEFPDELTTWIFLRRAPPHPAIPKDWVGRPVVALALCHCGATEEGRVWAKRFADLNPAIASTVDEIEYRQWQRALDTRWGTGFFNDWRGHYLDDLDAEATQILTKHVERLTSPWTDIKIPHLGALWHALLTPIRRTATAVRASGSSSRPRGSGPRLAPRRSPGSGSCVMPWRPMLQAGPMPTSLAATRRAAHGSKNMLRLRALKRKYDPANVFRLNPSVSPPC